MNTNKMYSQRAKQGNIPVVRICLFDCRYCAFERFRKMSKCQNCRDNVPHSHTEVLHRTPPKAKEGEFLTVGLSGDISFTPLEDFWQVIEYCRKWKDRTFLIQSKNPAYFLRFDSFKISVPDNVILGTTIESNGIYWHDMINGEVNLLHAYPLISKAPNPIKRYEAMLKLKDVGCRLLVTAEPLLDFLPDIFFEWIIRLNPIFYIGYANDGKQGKRLRLPEPPLAKTLELITKLREAEIDVREKTLRPAWYEEI